MNITQEQDMKIDQLYREMRDSLLTYAHITLKNPALAEEAVQETFRIACSKSDGMLSSASPKGWLVETLRNVMRNINRSRARWNNLIVASLSLDESLLAANADDNNTDMQYSDLLPPDDYKLLKRIAIDQYTMLEASEEFGLSIEACKKRVQRAKKKLKKNLEENL